MKHLCVALMACMVLMACSTKKTITEQVPIKEVLHDTIISKWMQYDSVYVRDSIYVTPEVEYRDRLVKKLTIVHDTVYVSRTDTVPKPIYIRQTIEHKAKWYETTAMWIGYLCCIAILLWLLFLYLKSKKN